MYYQPPLQWGVLDLSMLAARLIMYPGQLPDDPPVPPRSLDNLCANLVSSLHLTPGDSRTTLLLSVVESLSPPPPTHMSSRKFTGSHVKSMGIGVRLLPGRSQRSFSMEPPCSSLINCPSCFGFTLFTIYVFYLYFSLLFLDADHYATRESRESRVVL